MILLRKMQNFPISTYRLMYACVKQHFLPKRLKSLTSTKSKYQCEHLKRRALIKLTGPETLAFLQGLVTNDVRHLENNKETSVTLPCLYMAFLNQQGRLLYDSILYHFSNSSESSFLLECDSSVRENLIKHMKLYRVRKKIDIVSVEDKLSVWAVFPSSDTDQETLKSLASEVSRHFCGKDVPVIVTEDPRHAGLGYRYIFPNDSKINDILQLNQNDERLVDGQYAELRYKMGIGEGVEDHPPGKCFPLECNLDFLHGVSFHKGCYIGQELTARTHHTGVVRKRLMPVKILQENYVKIPPESVIINENGNNVGKFRGQEGHYGLALLRVNECLTSKHLSVKETNIELSTTKPFWWPQESTKIEKSKTNVG